MQTLAPLTELEAVNIMLGTIGESPVNSLSSESSNVDVATARQVLREFSTVVQGEGWNFNTENNWTLVPSLDTQEIPLPANCVQVDSTGVSCDLDLVARGTRLYDRTAHSYTFATPVTVEMVLLLPFEEMPPSCRYYVAVRAARVFQGRVVGSNALAAFSEQDEKDARAAFKRTDSNSADYNILRDSWSVARTLRR